MVNTRIYQLQLFTMD